MSSTGVDRITGIDPFVAVKAPCKVTSTTNITLSGSQTIDSVVVAETTPKTRVLVNGQTNAADNGIYDVYDTAWQRSTDFNGARDVVDSTFVCVDSGTLYGDTIWRVQATNPVVIGTTLISFIINSNFSNGIQIGTTFAALAFTSASVDRIINVARHTGGTIGGGQFIGVSGSVTNDGGTQINSATAGVYWKRINYDRIQPQMFGAIGDGVTNDYASFALAWAYMKERGGAMLIPPSVYYLNSTWVLDVSLTLPYNYEITGYGAQFLAGPSVTGFAIRVYKSYNNFGVKIEGLHFNHRNNTTVGGCIQTQGANMLRVVKCSLEGHNTKAGYTGIELGPYTAGDGDTNTFWTLIDGFTVRQRSGGDGTNMGYGIRLLGVANATKIINCEFSNVVYGINFATDGVAGSLANGCVILHNDFEGVTNAIGINTTLPCTSMPTGLRIGYNRVESTTTFLNINGAAGAVTEPSTPVITDNNYCTVGSVTNYMVNPNNQIVFIRESSYFGISTAAVTGGTGSYKIIAEGVGNNLKVANFSGTSSWQGAHVEVGGYHLWVDASARLRIKSGAPTSDTDGAVVGTQV